MNRLILRHVATAAVFAISCGGAVAPPVEDKSSGEPLLLEVDPAVRPWVPLPDRSQEVIDVSPWENFATHDSLNDRFHISSTAPVLLSVAERCISTRAV